MNPPVTNLPVNPAAGAAAGDIRLAGPGDLDIVVEILAAAFENEPVTAWIFPDPGRRRALLPGFFRTVAGDLLARGEILLSGVDGAFLVVPPGADAPGTAWRRRHETNLRASTAEYADRALRVGRVLDRHHPRQPAHYHVVFTGVRPDRQSRGTGSAIMRRLLARADDEGAGAYIECSSPGSMALMARHGFVARPPVTVPDGPVLVPAWRSPAPRQESRATGAAPPAVTTTEATP